jgi:hypothetical protein
VIYYKLHVKRDLIEERGESIDYLNSQRSLVSESKKNTEELIEEELRKSSTLPNINDKSGGSIPGNEAYVTKVFKHKFTDPVNIFFVYEEELFNYKTNSFIVSQEGDKVRVIVMRPG